MNRDRFYELVRNGEVQEGDTVIIAESASYLVVSAGNGRIRLDRELEGGSESLMLNTQMPSKRLAEASFEIDPISESKRLIEHVQGVY